MSTSPSPSPTSDQPRSEAGKPSPRLNVVDWLLAAGIALIAGAFVYFLTAKFGPDLARLSIGGRWFNSDGWRVFDDMVVFDANHYRNRVRPWFSLLAMPPVWIFRRVLGASPLEAIWYTNAICAAAWSFVMYFAFRCIGCLRLAAIACCALAIGSAGSFFWFTVPETYALSAAALAACILVAGVATFRHVPAVFPILTGAFAFGTVVTNWMASLAYLATFEKIKRSIVIAFATIVIAFCGWAVQKVIFPAPASLFLKNISTERNYTLHSDQGGPGHALHAAVVSSMVVPRVVEGDTTAEATGGRLSIQRTSALASTPIGIAAAVGWVALLGAGVVCLAWGGGDRRLRIFLAMLACGQLGLHSVYGEETFLYALHFVTVLVPIVAVAAAKWQRKGAAWVILAVAALVTINNVSRLQQAAATPFNGTDERLNRLAE